MAWEEYCAQYWLKDLQESMELYTGHRDITEILLKMVLNAIQLSNDLGKDSFENSLRTEENAGNHHFLPFMPLYW